jgi:dTMP kinase
VAHLQTKKARKLRKGLLVAIEGIDGAGKTTQAKLIKDRLEQEGYPVKLLHEPTNGKWGNKIRDLAKNGRHEVSPRTEFELFLKDRIEDVKKYIKPALEQKKIVIMDRYYISSVVYQGALGLDLDFIERENLNVAPKPDLTIILDLPSRVSLSRIKNRNTSGPNHFEIEKYLNKVRANLIKRYLGKADVAIINGKQTREKIASEIWNILIPIIQRYEEVSTEFLRRDYYSC